MGSKDQPIQGFTNLFLFGRARPQKVWPLGWATLGLFLYCFGGVQLAKAQDETRPVEDPLQANLEAAELEAAIPQGASVQDDRRQGLSWDGLDNQLIINDAINDTIWFDAGLRANDSILMINDQPVRTDADVEKALREAQLSTGKVDVTYSRQGVRNRVQVSPWSVPLGAQDESAPEPDDDDAGQAPAGDSPLETIRLEESGGQLLVTQVSTGSVWAAAGVQGDDVIALVNNQRVRNRAAFQAAVRNARQRKGALDITVLRDGGLYDLQVALADSSDAASGNRMESYYRGLTPNTSRVSPQMRSYASPYRGYSFRSNAYPGYFPSYRYPTYRRSYMAPYAGYYGGWNSGCYRRGLFGFGVRRYGYW